MRRVLCAGTPTLYGLPTLIGVRERKHYRDIGIITMQSLAFQNTQFDIVDRNGQPWLRSPQIAEALGYSQANRVTDVYNRNADEFTDSMTAVVKLNDLHPQSAEAAQTREVRIFSLRGAHLLGMLSRTKKAKEFRAWVLDVLEGIAEPKAPTRKRQPKALPNGLTIEQQDAIKAMVKARVEALPQEKRAKGAITCWSALKSKFGCTYKEISADQFTDAASLVARVVLDGEYLGKEQTPAPALNIHYPLSFITDQHPQALKPYTATHDQLDLSLYQLDERHGSAMESILHTLAQAGYQVDAAWFEIRTYRNKARDLERTLAALNNVFQSPMTYLVNKAAR